MFKDTDVIKVFWRVRAQELGFWAVMGGFVPQKANSDS